MEVYSSDQNLLDKILKDLVYDLEEDDDENLKDWLEPYVQEGVRYIPTFQKLAPCKDKEGNYTDPGLMDKKYWGTKWDVVQPWATVKEGSIDITFDTAWNPPDIWFRKLCNKYPDVSIHLFSEEGGMWFEVNQWHDAGHPFYYEEWDYHAPCEQCDVKNDDVTYDDELEWWYCIKCKNEILENN